MNEPSRKLAATVLDVPVDADRDAVRAAFLKKLAGVQFVPPEEWLAAVNLLNGTTVPLTPDAMMVLAEYEKADVDKFLLEYWVLPPAERQQRWTALNKRCHDADNRDTLLRLKDGLKVDVKFHSNLTMQMMAEFIREIYLLPIRSRAIRRMEWCVDQPRETVLASLGKQFLEVDAEMASIEPQLMCYLKVSHTTPFEAPALTPEARDLLDIQNEAKLQEQKEPISRNTIKAGLLGLFLFVAFVRGCMVFQKDNDVPREKYYPVNPVPKLIKDPFGKSFRFTNPSPTKP